METKKEEAIRKAYGEYWEQVKHFIDDEGWMYRIDFPTKHNIELEEHPNQYHIRPKSLQGIETNNGWIRIDSEDDLPNEDGTYWFLKDGKVQLFDRVCNYKANTKHLLRTASHYQPIVKPKLPIC